MKFTKYLKDKLYAIIIFLSIYLIILLLFLSFKIDSSLILALSIILFTTFTSLLLIDYFRKKSFYTSLLENIKGLDKSYLVLETLNNPAFYECKLLKEALYEINKSYIENINKNASQIADFKDYIEMWIHEVKIPLSSLILITHNHKNSVNSSEIKQIKRIDDYLEQVLYYVRSENASKDYYINKVNLEKTINSVALRNKDYILESNITFETKNINKYLYTDSKWLEFILNQIISNSIKYKDNKKESYIKINTKEGKETVTITIEDNGLGISKSDLPRIFEKSFTGSNGRNNTKSTGMGLFITKNLCEKLGHTIKVESEVNKYTKVSITISTNKFYEVVN